MTSHEVTINVGTEHIANVYAKAFLGVTEKAGATEQHLEELDTVVDELFGAFPLLEETLVSRLVSDDDKLGILDRILKGRASEVLVNFLKVVAARGRLDCLRAIRRSIHDQVDALRGRCEVEIRYAAEVDRGVTQEIVALIQRQWGLEPKPTVTIDPSLLGGVIIRIGNMVCDGSLATRLQSMRSAMIRETVQRIQTGRECFENGSETN